MIKKTSLLFILLHLLLQSLLVVPSFASQQVGLDLAVVAINNKNWLGAKKLLESLYEKNSNDNNVKNLLAVVYFNIGKLELAQELLVSVIESHQDSKYAYKNLEKLFAYSAAKTYSKGLNLLTPVELPEMLIVENTHLNSAPETPVDDDDNSTIVATKPEKYINRTSFWQEQLQETLAKQSQTNNDLKPEKSVELTTQVTISQEKSLEKPLNESANKTQTEALHAELIDALRKRLILWRTFWMKGNTEQYISIYTSNYSPSDKSRYEWLENRKNKVLASRNIQVEISNQQTQLLNKQLAVVEFDQYYQSNHYQDKVRKRLYWKKINNEWYISREVVVDVL